MTMTPCDFATNITTGIAVRTDLSRLESCNHLSVEVSGTVDGADVDNWALDIRVPALVTGIYGAKCDAVSATTYRITPDPWTRKIPGGHCVRFGLIFA
ncbi:hypothetical protein RDV64_19910 [Acuticoccus sp. MNP-M23]|uniref:hypothetical protein n=1 Tax=Acuticoccus sp. MNP-M23 TaxID=3072793 RepID=UPI002815B2B2|nr:hypothetical protein [Acuticoccus sp. MNP-M23]WMS42304.1 hypothetical protein RDV64_19910 [Acuticoccus sp. MNP-M23]